MTLKEKYVSFVKKTITGIKESIKEQRQYNQEIEEARKDERKIQALKYAREKEKLISETEFNRFKENLNNRKPRV